ncbi:class I SAM-dependent methyltransferase [Nocardia macrotermitis]|uniref:S-adenosyl-L-methionine-dependent methyltransferase n=1 Tax=Nocardia macrotermitis TaxID=2585198 RepID=A0A7K0D4Y7_9NOCA|nr:class I SAM-dependent methyltransferase [Nocardia macrotermitis]MQY20621.1 putative S-adenosyl-L-methionine-dependent methyltransferase [Nocardia macrotermitis]
MRTDGDTWDIVSSVGITALGVATFRATETALPDALIRDEYARLFVEAAAEPRSLQALAAPEDSEFLPVARLIGVRTKFFDEFFLAAAAAGVRQAVILAAGLDARAYRLDWPIGASVFEIDQPKVLDFKHQVLADNEVAPRAVLRAVGVDLRDDWPGALFDAGFDADRPTAWSAEGLLPYLPGAAQDSLFERIDTLSAPGSQLAVEGFSGRPDIARISRAANQEMATSPFGDVDVAELFYADDRADPVQWLTDRGWQVNSADVTELATRYGRPVPRLPEGMGDMHDVAVYTTATK